MHHAGVLLRSRFSLDLTIYLFQMFLPVCNFIFFMIRPLAEFQGSSQFHGHDPWPYCKVECPLSSEFYTRFTSPDRHVDTIQLGLANATWRASSSH